MTPVPDCEDPQPKRTSGTRVTAGTAGSRSTRLVSSRARAIEQHGELGVFPLLCEAKIGRRMRLHDLRHSGATAMLNGYADGEKLSITEVGTMLGHKSVKTTQIYARTGEDDLANEMARRHARARESGTHHGTPDPPPSSAPSQVPEEARVLAVRPVRLERTTRGLEGRCSIQLSYGRV